jgi:uncharacterized repeat protein (TIGR03803 family)
MDASGNLYGVTPYGGTEEGGNGGGIVFELSPTAQGQWTETIIHTFQGGTDGALPLAGLIFDPQGNLYGTTSGESNRGAGTVFKLTPGSHGTWKHSVLYNFAEDNAYTQSSLIFDSAGNLYGTAQGGPGVGCDGGGCGLVFELTPGSNDSWSVVFMPALVDGLLTMTDETMAIRTAPELKENDSTNAFIAQPPLELQINIQLTVAIRRGC